MRIVEATQDRLTLDERPWVLGGILIAVILFMLFLALATFADAPWLGLGMALGAGLFGLCFVIFVRRVIVIFDRPAGAVVIRSASLLGQTETTLPLAGIRGAGVETRVSSSSSSSGGRSQTHRTVLQFHDGAEPHPLTQIHSGGQGADRAAQAINIWLGLRAEAGEAR
jgi:hypothetical protein